MKTTHRDYSEAAGDFNRISRFIVANNAHLRSHSTWCLGRFVDWKFGLWGGKLATPNFWEKNAQLWFDGFGQLAGLAISEDGAGDIAILTSRGYRMLFEEILGWALARWGDRKPALSLELTALQEMEAELLAGSGFQRHGAFYTFSFDLTAEPLPLLPLEPGYTIVDMASHPDYRAQHLLRQDAFEGKTVISEEEIERVLALYHFAQQSPIYHAPTDLCVMSPDGTLVAGCEALIDPRNLQADIERICTHSRYRRRGFARAVIQECMARLRQMGLQRAYITGYDPEAVALYHSLGAQGQAESMIYRLDAEHAPSL